MKAVEIRNWLKDNGKDRQWLAEQVGASKSTVDGWLSGRPIPAPTQKLIEIALAKPPPIRPEMSWREWEEINERAKAEQMDPDAWVIAAALKEARSKR